MLRRLLTHLFYPSWRLRRAFPERTLKAIEQAVKESEQTHLGEIRVAIERALEPAQIWKRQSARERALEVFAQLHVWDSELNNGVLVYVLLADRDVEIVADRGIGARVEPQRWQAICHALEQAYATGDFENGTVRAIREISALLAQHFPVERENPNELPDKPVVR